MIVRSSAVIAAPISSTSPRLLSLAARLCSMSSWATDRTRSGSSRVPSFMASTNPVLPAALGHCLRSCLSLSGESVEVRGCLNGRTGWVRCHTMDRTTPTTAGLLPRDRDILDFERGWWQQRGPKETAVRERFGFSAARYQQLLNRAIDLPEAL